MQDAIQSQKKIEESLYNFGHDHTGGKNARLWPKIIYLKRKGLFLRTKPSHFGEARGGRKGVSHLVRVPCVYGTHQECHNRPTLPACVCVCVCVLIDYGKSYSKCTGGGCSAGSGVYLRVLPLAACFYSFILLVLETGYEQERILPAGSEAKEYGSILTIRP